MSFMTLKTPKYMCIIGPRIVSLPQFLKAQYLAALARLQSFLFMEWQQGSHNWHSQHSPYGLRRPEPGSQHSPVYSGRRCLTVQLAVAVIADSGPVGSPCEHVLVGVMQAISANSHMKLWEVVMVTMLEQEVAGVGVGVSASTL